MGRYDSAQKEHAVDEEIIVRTAEQGHTDWWAEDVDDRDCATFEDHDSNRFESSCKLKSVLRRRGVGSDDAAFPRGFDQ